MKWLVCLLLLLPFTLLAQPQNVLVSGSQNSGEPTLSINPRNPAQIVAGCNLARFFYSQDTGRTWTSGTLTSPLGVFGDPCLLFDTTGRVHYFHLAGARNQPTFLESIVQQTAPFPPTAWSSGTAIGRDGKKRQDKEWATCDPRNNNMYLAWCRFDSLNSEAPGDSSHIVITRSRDGGQTWGPLKRINYEGGTCLDDDSTNQGSVPAIGPGGEVYVAWAGPSGIVFNRSLDSGTTWMPREQRLQFIPDGYRYSIPGIFRISGQPTTTCDNSNGPYRGTVYVTWADQRSGTTDTDVWMMHSQDRGQTWSQPIRVNDDPAGRHQFMPWVSVDPVTGHIWTVFYDRRNYTDNRLDVYMAVSQDGGQTFRNFKVNELPIFAIATVFLGDYIGVSAVNNVVRPIWAMNMQSPTTLRLYTALVNTRSILTDVRPEKGLPLQLTAHYSAQDRAITARLLQGEIPAGTRLKICDVEGRILATTRALTAGTRMVDIPADLTQGVYILTASGEKLSYSIRFMAE